MQSESIHTPEELREFERKAEEAFNRLQPALLPEHADEIIAIEPETGDYVLGKTKHEVWQKRLQRFPGKLTSWRKVDGGPVTIYRNRLK